MTASDRTISIEGILGSVTFLPCRKCAAPTMASRERETGDPIPAICMNCEDRAVTARERDEEMARAARSIPKRYAWSWFGAEQLLLSRIGSRSKILEARDHATSERVIFVGGAGTGKTSLAVALLRERARLTQTPGFFFAAHRLGVARIQHRAGDGEAEIVEQAATSALALIDDVGIDRATSTNAVPDVILERYDEELPTIVTTGFDIDAIAKRYGDGIARRLFEGATVIELGGRT